VDQTARGTCVCLIIYDSVCRRLLLFHRFDLWEKLSPFTRHTCGGIGDGGINENGADTRGLTRRSQGLFGRTLTLTVFTRPLGRLRERDENESRWRRSDVTRRV